MLRIWGAGSRGAGVVGDAIIITALSITRNTRIMLLLVSQHAVFKGESPIADITTVRSFPGVSTHMTTEIFRGPEFSVAEKTNNFSVHVIGKFSPE